MLAQRRADIRLAGMPQVDPQMAQHFFIFGHSQTTLQARPGLGRGHKIHRNPIGLLVGKRDEHTLAWQKSTHSLHSGTPVMIKIMAFDPVLALSSSSQMVRWVGP
jgi:hypothetical protein